VLSRPPVIPPANTFREEEVSRMQPAAPSSKGGRRLRIVRPDRSMRKEKDKEDAEDKNKEAVKEKRGKSRTEIQIVQATNVEGQSEPQGAGEDEGTRES